MSLAEPARALLAFHRSAGLRVALRASIVGVCFVLFAGGSSPNLAYTVYRFVLGVASTGAGPGALQLLALLGLVAGIERPDEAAARSALAYVPEYPDFTPYATVEEVLRLVCRLRKRPPGEVGEALERTGLAELRGRSVRELSMGQRRRALLAAALIGDPRVVVLDEPLESMDRATRELIVGWVERLRAGGRCVLVATHETAPFAHSADPLLRLEEGRTRLLDPVPDEERARLG